jgi:hypothetical protein
MIARWHHPERGINSPEKFICIAEALGLMMDLTLLVLEAACRGWKTHNLRGRLALTGKASGSFSRVPKSERENGMSALSPNYSRCAKVRIRGHTSLSVT